MISSSNFLKISYRSTVYYREGKINLKERRKSTRIELNILVNYAQDAKARAKNISDSGIRIRTKESFRIKKFLTLTFKLPEKSETRAYARLIWCKKTDSGLHDTGLEFWDIKNDDKEIVRRFVIDSLRKGSET